MDSAHGKDDDPGNAGETGSSSDSDTAPDHAAAGGRPASDADAEVSGGEIDSGPGEAATAGGSGEKGTVAGQPAPRWQRWGKAGGKALWVQATAVAGAVAVALAVAWALIYLGPHASTTSTIPQAAGSLNQPIGNPGHAPGNGDVSTTKPGQRFYAVPNFYDFPACGRPCWLPLYQEPTQQSEDVTQGWPCEYYDPASTVSGGTCLQPPSGRTPAEMADAAVKDSGDRVLVLCQVTEISAGEPAQNVSNSTGQSSDIWDMIAVPAADVSHKDTAAPLTAVPGMPGFYEAFGPDIWLGNTHWHDIPCK